MLNTANTNTVEVVQSFFQPDTLIAFECFEALRKKSQLEPEKRLLLAVLEDAVVCFQKHLFTREGVGQRLFGDAREWIFEESDDRIFSFESICEILGFDPGCFRKGLLLWERKKRGGDKSAHSATPDKKEKLISYVFPADSSPPNRFGDGAADGI